MRTEGEVQDALNRTQFAWGGPDRAVSDEWLKGLRMAFQWVLGDEEVGDIDLTHGEAVPSKEAL